MQIKKKVAQDRIICCFKKQQSYLVQNADIHVLSVIRNINLTMSLLKMTFIALFDLSCKVVSQYDPSKAH